MNKKIRLLGKKILFPRNNYSPTLWKRLLQTNSNEAVELKSPPVYNNKDWLIADMKGYTTIKYKEFIDDFIKYVKFGSIDMKLWFPETEFEKFNFMKSVVSSAQQQERLLLTEQHDYINFCSIAAEYGNLYTLKSLTALGFVLDNDAFYKASINGHTEVLDWLKKNNFTTKLSSQFFDLLCENVIRNGKLEVLKWYKENSFNIHFNNNLTEIAVASNDLEILKWLIEENRCPINKKSLGSTNKKIQAYLDSLIINPFTGQLIWKKSSWNDLELLNEKKSKKRIEVNSQVDIDKISQIVAKNIRDNKNCENLKIYVETLIKWDKNKQLYDTVCFKILYYPEIKKQIDQFVSHVEMLKFHFNEKIERWLEENRYIKIDSEMVDLFELMIFSQKYKQYCNIFSTDIDHFGICGGASYNKNLTSLKYFKEKGFPIGSHVSYFASINNDTEILDWLWYNNHPIRYLTNKEIRSFNDKDDRFAIMIKKGNLDALKWYRSSYPTLPFEHDMTNLATTFNSLKVLKWLVEENNCPIRIMTCKYVAKINKNQEMNKYLNSLFWRKFI